jgi:hypothetical protein
LSFPVPWAEESHMSALETVDDLQDAMKQSGMEIQEWIASVQTVGWGVIYKPAQFSAKIE